MNSIKRTPSITPDELEESMREFLAGVSVIYWDGLYADELMALHFGWSVA